VPGEGSNAYPIGTTVAPRGYTIRCAVNGKDELDYIKFIYNGTEHDEFREPRWMSSASAVFYLSSCGPKTVRVQGHVWSKLCFETHYDLTAQCSDDSNPRSPMAAPVVVSAPAMAPKAAAPVQPPKALDSPVAAPFFTAPRDPPKTSPIYSPRAPPVLVTPVAAPMTAPAVAPVLPPNALPSVVVAAPMAMPVATPVAVVPVAPIAPVTAPAVPVMPPTKGDSPVASPLAPATAPIAPVAAQPVAPVTAPKAPSVASPTAPVASPTKCPPGYKLVSGYCVIESCQCDFKCPANMERIPNRKCYKSIKDCACPKGYTRRKFGRTHMCRKTVICAHGMTWWGSCKSAPK
jgi:hypothetical protein